MKRILALFLVMMSIVLPSIAQNSQERSKLKVIELDLRAGTQKPTMLRAPMRISVEAYYNMSNSSLNLRYFY